MDTNTRATTTWSFVLLAVFATMWLTMSVAPQSVVMRESAWAFPAALLIHAVGLVLSIGPRLALDLRLAGWALRRTPVSSLVARITPWTIAGGVLAAISGLALYSSEVVRLSSNAMFQIKMGALALALINVWFFHAVSCRHISQWDSDAVLPASVRASGYLSLLLWAAVLVAGRLTAYSGS